MMKLRFKLVLANLLCLSTFSAVADLSNSQYNQEQTKANTQDLAKYLLHLGGYLGFELKKTPPIIRSSAPFSRELIDITATLLPQNRLFMSVLGAIPVTLSQFIPNNFPNAASINTFANTTFKNPPFDTPNPQEGSISVTPLIDQKVYQKDPVSQAVLNILGTPDYSVCLTPDGTLDENCNQLHQSKIISKVIGPIPASNEFYTYDYNQQFIDQLNINSLLSPLLYSTQNSSGYPGNDSANKGLEAKSQAQQAANFIRYASGAVTPTALPDQDTYQRLYNAATAKPLLGATGPSIPQITAQNTLTTYLANLRVYAAQSSVGMGNLYYILSKRIPQNLAKDASGNSNTTSQALSEFNLATWRLKPADPYKNQEAWAYRIEAASAETVQKEIAILLAEINYQMYLSRQQDERMLLTQTMMLIQNTKAAQPAALPVHTSDPVPQ